MEVKLLNFFKDLHSVEPLEISTEDLIKEIKGIRHEAATLQYRLLNRQLQCAMDGANRNEELIASLKKSMTDLKCNQPAVAFSVILDGGRSEKCIKSFTGLFMVDVDDLDDESTAEVIRLAKEDRHTLMAFTTISGGGVRIVSAVDFEVNLKNFRKIWVAVNMYFSKLFGKEIDKKCKNPTRLSVICRDPNLYLNRSATKFSLDELQQPQENQGVKRNGRPTTAARAERVVIRLVEDEGVRYEPHNHNNYICRCLYWMNRFGVPLDGALAWALKQFGDYDPASVASIAKSCYANRDEFSTRRLQDFMRGDRSCNKRSSVEDVEKFLNERIDIRYNEITHSVEIRYLNSDEWQRITDTIESSLWREMCHNGLNFDIFQLRLILNSDFAKSFNPVKVYLDSLAPWDGQDHIAEMAGQIRVKGFDQLKFQEMFRRWLVAMVAGVLYPHVVNQVIFVLIGKQGCFKSSFMGKILPPCLRRYYATKLDSSSFNKDDKLMLTEYILINVEEIDCMRPQELSQLKAMTTVTYVNERPAYGRNRVHLPHIASLCATGNNPFFLTDDTGNRRWLAFEVDSIDNPWTTEINYEGVYSQVYALLKSNFRYWFNDDEIREINMNNKRFESPNPAKELLLTYYRKPADGEKSIPITSSQILARFGGAIRLTTSQIGRALRNLNFEYSHTRNGNFWLVVERTTDEIRNTLPEPAEELNV